MMIYDSQLKLRSTAAVRASYEKNYITVITPHYFLLQQKNTSHKIQTLATHSSEHELKKVKFVFIKFISKSVNKQVQVNVNV